MLYDIIFKNDSGEDGLVKTGNMEECELMLHAVLREHGECRIIAHGKLRQGNKDVEETKKRIAERKRNTYNYTASVIFGKKRKEYRCGSLRSIRQRIIDDFGFESMRTVGYFDGGGRIYKSFLGTLVLHSVVSHPKRTIVLLNHRMHRIGSVVIMKERRPR